LGEHLVYTVKYENALYPKERNSSPYMAHKQRVYESLQFSKLTFLISTQRPNHL